MNRLELKFKTLRKARKKAFIAFITAGYPDLATTEKLIKEFDRIGVDVVELGVPFTDPMADGPVIQEASREALKKRVSLAGILSLVKKVRGTSEIPLCLMTYYNPVFCFGEARFIKQAASCGVDGIIIPDLPPDEGAAFMRLAAEAGVDTICFIAPTSTPARMKLAAKKAKGFIYYVSLTGVTGPRQALPANLAANIRKIKSITAKPVCVGFGVSTPEQVRTICRVADGVIVGSAIVREIKEQRGNSDLVKKVGALVTFLKGKGKAHVSKN